MQNKLTIWEKDEYYDLAKRGSLDINHPGMQELLAYAENANRILDFGCGEGTRLGLLTGKGKELYGVDLSRKAIQRAKNKHPGIWFVHGKIQDIDVGKNFDLIYSAFVLEHTRKTEDLLIGLIKKLKKGGILLLMAPNYGAPNRASPVASYSRTVKLIIGVLKDLRRLMKKSDKLGWREVEPTADINTYEMDFDTTIEPYIGTLVDFLYLNNTKIIRADSVWERELENVKLLQRLFRMLGEKGLYPFKFWGPHLLVIAKKT